MKFNIIICFILFCLNSCTFSQNENKSEIKHQVKDNSSAWKSYSNEILKTAKLSKSILDTLNNRAPRFLYKKGDAVIIPYNILSKDEQSKIFEGLLKLDASIYCLIELPFDNNKQISISNLNLLKAYIRVTDSLNNEGYDRTAPNILESLHDKRIDIKTQSLTFHNIVYSLRYKDEKSRQKVSEGWESLNITDVNETKDGVYFYYSEKIPNNTNVLKILVYVPHKNPKE